MFIGTPISARYYSIIRTILVLAYLIGIVGLQLPALSSYFRPLSPLILVCSLVVLLLYHTDWRPSFCLYIILALLTGFFIEVLGVHTGIVFGNYTYGWGLGLKVWGVPLMIGINWLILSYCCGSICNNLPIPIWGKIIAAATLMVLLDFFIEPIAVQLDFWTWFGHVVPLQNYVGWWLFSIILFSIWYFLPFHKENRLAKWLLALQFVFFIGQILFMFH